MKVYISYSIDSNEFHEWLRHTNWRLLTSHSKSDGNGRSVGAHIYQTDELSDGDILMLKLQWPILGAFADDGTERWASDDFKWLTKRGYD